MDDAQHEGFTLIELLIALAIAALLSGMAVPAMARFLDNARLRAATENIARELVLARNHAYIFHKPIYFNIAVTDAAWCYGWGESPDCDCGANRAQTRCQTGASDPVRAHLQTSLDYPKIRLILPARQGRSRLLRFSPLRGTATGSSFSLKNHRGQTRIIISILGRVRTCSPDIGGYPACRE